MQTKSFRSSSQTKYSNCDDGAQGVYVEELFMRTLGGERKYVGYALTIVSGLIICEMITKY